MLKGKICKYEKYLYEHMALEMCNQTKDFIQFKISFNKRKK